MSQTEHAGVGKPTFIDKPHQLCKRNYLLPSPVIIGLILLFIFWICGSKYQQISKKAVNEKSKIRALTQLGKYFAWLSNAVTLAGQKQHKFVAAPSPGNEWGGDRKLFLVAHL